MVQRIRLSRNPQTPKKGPSTVSRRLGSYNPHPQQEDHGQPKVRIKVSKDVCFLFGAYDWISDWAEIRKLLEEDPSWKETRFLIKEVSAFVKPLPEHFHVYARQEVLDLIEKVQPLCSRRAITTEGTLLICEGVEDACQWDGGQRPQGWT